MLTKYGSLFAAAATLGTLAVGAASPVQAQTAAVKVGVLTCQEASGWGFVFGSSRKLRCNFSPAPGHSDRYTGTISDFGVDIGYLQGGVIIWAVLAPTNNLRPGDLAGNYVGASGNASVGVGAGANVLLGGNRHSISLQPVSIAGQTGLNVAAGIGKITLHYNPR